MPARAQVRGLPDTEKGGETVATLRLNKSRLATYRRLAKIETDGQLAESIGVHPATVSRILHGTQAPGPRFIAGLVVLFGAELFGELFEVVGDNDEGAAA